jgi:hypothetical protein
MRLGWFVRTVARGWHLVWGDAHRNVAEARRSEAVRKLDSARHHAGKALEHDRRADALGDEEPTETGVERRPFRPF